MFRKWAVCWCGRLGAKPFDFPATEGCHLSFVRYYIRLHQPPGIGASANNLNATLPWRNGLRILLPQSGQQHGRVIYTTLHHHHETARADPPDATLRLSGVYSSERVLSIRQQCHYSQPSNKSSNIEHLRDLVIETVLVIKSRDTRPETPFP